MTRWTDQTTEHVKAAIAANTCPLCGGRLSWVTFRRLGEWGRFKDERVRQCRSCGAEVGVEPEPPCQLKAL